MKKLSTAVLVVFALDVMMGLAQSQSLQITGTAGYLSEFELSGTVNERTSSGRTEFFGPLLWKHVGLCSADGPQEKRGDIKFEMSRAGSLSQIDATISFDGMQCRYKGPFSGASGGRMDCSGAQSVPLSISVSHWPKTP
jgi:hypothetical protein